MGPSAPGAGAGDGELRVAPRRFGPLRRGAFRAVETTARLLGGRALYRRAFLAPGRFAVRRETLAVADLPAGLAGFRVAQLSDLHAGPFLGPGDLRHVVDAVNALRPDAVVITGDLIVRRWREALAVLDDLAALAAPHGVFGVFGNHDYHGRMEGHIAAAFAERGIRFLRNACARLDTGDGVLALVGLEDLEEGRVVDLARARAGLEPGDVEIALCHNPLGARALARPGCVAVLSGHTHGGQVDLPLLRGLGPPHPGERTELGPTALIVSRGLGVLGIPVRLGVPAEVVLVELVRGEGARAG